MEGARNGIAPYSEVTIEKHSFDIAKKQLGDDKGNTAFIGKGIIVEIGGRNGAVLDYAKSRREQYDKPPWSLPDYRQMPKRPMDPFR